MNKYNGRNDLHAHLARWVQEYGKKPTRMHMSSALRDMVNKHVLGEKMCKWLFMFERQYVGRTIVHKFLHAKAFKKVCNALNKVCNVQ